MNVSLEIGTTEIVKEGKKIASSELTRKKFSHSDFLLQNVHRFDGIWIHSTGCFFSIGLFKNNVRIDIIFTYNFCTFIYQTNIHHHFVSIFLNTRSFTISTINQFFTQTYPCLQIFISLNWRWFFFAISFSICKSHYL